MILPPTRSVKGIDFFYLFVLFRYFICNFRSTPSLIKTGVEIHFKVKYGTDIVALPVSLNVVFKIISLAHVGYEDDQFSFNTD